MKLDGALKPHGAYPIGGSIGAKNKYRDKIHTNNNNTSNNNLKIGITSLTCCSRSCGCSSCSMRNLRSVQKPIVVGDRRSTNNMIKRIDVQKNMSSSKSFVSRSANRKLSENRQTQKRRTGNQQQTSAMKNDDDDDDGDSCMDSDSAGGDGGGGIIVIGTRGFQKIMRVQQSLFGYGFSSTLFLLCLLYVFILLPDQAYCDDNDNYFINPMSQGPPEMTTPEFDYASRGAKKFGDKCNNTLECGFPGSICDSKKKACQCTEDLQITNHIDKCGKEAAHNESCFFNEQCESFFFQTECRDGRCICRFELQAVTNNGKFDCVAKAGTKAPEQYVDPAMIGVLVGMALMFIIICVVLRLFSQARWHENRTIFNTPNPRLMNVSLLRESKLLHGQERRGSRMSVRAPSRQPSMASLRPHSPNPSLGSRGSNSNGSGHSFRSRSDSTTNPHHANTHAPAAAATGGHHAVHHPPQSHPHPHPHHHEHHHHEHHHEHHQDHKHSPTQHQPLIAHIPNTGTDNVTVEIIEPSKNHHTDI